MRYVFVYVCVDTSYLRFTLGQGQLGQLAAQCENRGGAISFGPASAVPSHERRGEKFVPLKISYVLVLEHMYVCIYV